MDMQGEAAAAFAEIELDARRRRRGAVLDRQREPLTVAPQVEVAVAPRVQFGRAAERLSGAGVAALARVVDEHDGAAEAALQLAQVGEQRRDLGGGVLVDAVQAHEGVEDDEPRPQAFDLLAQARAVGRDVEADDGIDDHVDVEAVQRDLCGCTDSAEASAHDVGRVLGGVQQHGAAGRDREAPEAGHAGGDADGHAEREEGLAAFRLATDDPDRGLGPRAVDQPALRRGPLGELAGAADVESIHRRLPPAARFGADASVAWPQTSR